MTSNGGGYTIPMSLARKLESEGRRSFKSTEHGTMTIKTCNRCGGGGQYSFNLMHGTRCYGCGGTGVVAVVGTPEEVAAQDAKKAAAREKAAARRQAKQVAAEAARIVEESRILSGIGCQIMPTMRQAPKIMASLYDGVCRQCGDDIKAGDQIAYNGSARHIGCYGDMLLDDIDAVRASDRDAVSLSF